VGRGDLEWTNKAKLAPRRMEGGLVVRRVGIKNALVKPNIASCPIWAGAAN